MSDWSPLDWAIIAVVVVYAILPVDLLPLNPLDDMLVTVIAAWYFWQSGKLDNI